MTGPTTPGAHGPPSGLLLVLAPALPPGFPGFMPGPIPGPAPVVPPAPPVGGAVPVLFGGGGVQLPLGSQQVPPVHARPDPHRLSSHGQPSEPTTQKLVPLPVAAPVPSSVPAEPKLAPVPFAPPLPVPDPPVELFPEQAATKIANAAQNFEACRMGKPFLSRCGETRTSSSTPKITRAEGIRNGQTSWQDGWNARA
jgi:hypothetical protein